MGHSQGGAAGPALARVSHQGFEVAPAMEDISNKNTLGLYDIQYQSRAFERRHAKAGFNVSAGAATMWNVADFVAAGFDSLDKPLRDCVAYAVLRNVFPDFNEVISCRTITLDIKPHRLAAAL